VEVRTLEQRLALAESRILHGDVQLSRQRTMVRHLERHGLVSFQARKLLKELEENQAAFVAERDRLESEMAALPATAPLSDDKDRNDGLQADTTVSVSAAS